MTVQHSKAIVRRCGQFLLTASALACSFQAQAASSANDLRLLLEAKQPQAAFEAGVASDSNLGEPEFDFFFGIAALETDHPAEAVLALERYTLRFPDNASARFHLGRAYFAASEDDAAKREFLALQASQKGDILEGSSRYLAAIAARSAERKPQWGMFLEAGAGYDTNITTGIDSGSQPVVPGFGTLPVQPDLSTGVAAADSFAFLGFGVQGTVPIDPYLRLIGSMNADVRAMAHSENAMFSQRGIRADGGLQFEAGANRYRAVVGYSQAWLDGARYVATPSLVGEVAHQVGDTQQIALNVQLARPTYTDGCSYFLRDRDTSCVDNQASGRDADVVGLGLGWSYQGTGAWSPLVSLGLSAAKERNLRDNPALSRRIDGARANVSVTMSANWTLGMGFNWQRSLYAEKYPVADTERNDRQTSIDASLAYRISDAWLLRAEAASSRQDSNIGLYAYRRDVVSLAVWFSGGS
jgi:hypothetical protein